MQFKCLNPHWSPDTLSYRAVEQLRWDNKGEYSDREATEEVMGKGAWDLASGGR